MSNYYNRSHINQPETGTYFTMPTIRVLIADDHRLMRRSLRQICEIEGGFEVVAEATADGFQQRRH